MRSASAGELLRRPPVREERHGLGEDDADQRQCRHHRQHECEEGIGEASRVLLPVVVVMRSTSTGIKIEYRMPPRKSS